MWNSRFPVHVGITLAVGVALLGSSIGIAMTSAEVGRTARSALTGPLPARPVIASPVQGHVLQKTATPTFTPLPMQEIPADTATPAALRVAARPDSCGLLTDFEQFGAWTRGDEAYGTFTQSAEQAYSGSYSGKLSYIFPTPGNDYVVFRRNIPMGGVGTALTMWVYGDGSGHMLNAWVKDATGEVWSFPFGRVMHVGWQQMVAPLDVNGAWPTGHISGPANGVLDHPINFNGLVLDDAPDTYAGSGILYVDDLSCAEGPNIPINWTPGPPTPSPTLPPWANPLPPVPPPPSGNCLVMLSGPPNGSEFGEGTQAVQLTWQFNRPLQPNEYFFVNVEFPHGGATWYDGTWRDPSQQLPDGTRDTQWTLRDYLCQPGFSDNGWYDWSVTVKAQLGPEKSLSDPVVCRSEKWRFRWTGCQPTPEPTDTPELQIQIPIKKKQLSDRNAKENFGAVNGQGLLARLVGVPVSTWNYKGEDTSARHLGPMAQDFYAALGMGDDHTEIYTIDANGANLAAIQALYELSSQQATRVAELEQQVTELQGEVKGSATPGSWPLTAAVGGVVAGGLGAWYVQRRRRM